MKQHQGQHNQPDRLNRKQNVLNSAIQAEVGRLVGGERARAVLGALKQELAQLVTDTGRPKAGRPLAEETTRLETLQRDLMLNFAAV